MLYLTGACIAIAREKLRRSPPARSHRKYMLQPKLAPCHWATADPRSTLVREEKKHVLFHLIRIALTLTRAILPVKNWH
jgi:hypothetical protein